MTKIKDTDIINFGFLGTGSIAQYSAAAIRRHTRGRVVAAQDLSLERVRDFCASENIPKAYGTAQELFEDPEVDAVYIAVPNKFHAGLAIQAMEAGKHVILEKPFTMNLAEAELVAATAQKTGLAFMLGMNQRFGHSAQVTKARIERGDFGEIYHLKAYWLRRAGIPKLGTWFGSKQMAGAGCLYDIGVHLLDLSLHLVNNFDPVSVSAATYTKFGHLGLGGGQWGKSDVENLLFDVEDFATGLLRFADGSTLSLDVSWACHTDQDSRSDIQIYGTKAGGLVLEGKFFHQETSGEFIVAEGSNIPVRYPHNDRFHNFINHLLGQEDLCVTIDQALAVQKILDAMAASAASGREVVLARNP